MRLAGGRSESLCRLIWTGDSTHHSLGHLAAPSQRIPPITNRSRRNPQVPAHKTRRQTLAQKPFPFLPELTPLRPELPFRQPQFLRYLPLMDFQPGKNRIPGRVEVHVIPAFPPAKIPGLRRSQVLMLHPALNQPSMKSRAIKPPFLSQDSKGTSEKPKCHTRPRA